MNNAKIQVLAPEIPVEPTFREIALAYVCYYHEITPAEFKGKRVFRQFVQARKMFVWLTRRYRPKLSYPTIGRWINRDHSSVVYLDKASKELADEDEEFRQACARFPAFYAQRSTSLVE